MNEFFNDFNNKQLEAIKCDKDKICVFAGPGTGKTKALVGRYIYLVNELHVDPLNILAITFTKKAANEMVSKIKTVLPNNPTIYISTIHSLCFKIVKKEINLLNIKENPTIIDDNDKRALIYDILNALDIDKDSEINIKAVKEYIEKRKSKHNYIRYFLNKNKIFQEAGFNDEESLNKANSLNEEELYNLCFLMYLKYQIINNYLDFDDLICFSIDLFNKKPDILEEWSYKFRYVLVDEFQDLTDNEYQLIKLLSSKHNNLFGVGDPDQSIYGFRGSKVSIFNDFYKESDAKFTFEKSYRSYQSTLNLAHDLIKCNEDRVVDVNLISNKGDNNIPKLIHTKTRDDEATYVVDEIKRLINETPKLNKSDIAILYRTNNQSLTIEQHLILNKIPYKIYSKKDFFNTPEIKTAMAYIRFFLRYDDVSFLNIYNKPTRYISNEMIKILKGYAKRKNTTIWEAVLDNFCNPIFKNRLDSLVDLNRDYQYFLGDNFYSWCRNILKYSGFADEISKSRDEDKINNLDQFMNLIEDFEPTNPNDVANEFLEYISLMSDGDFNEEDDKVQLMSIHCSKGMEYKYVFLIDFNEGFIPLSKATTIEDLKEERRMCYVALTRAKEQLYILESSSDVECKNRGISSYYSSFNKDHFVEEKYNYQNDIVRYETLYVGQNVINKYYGKGQIIGISNNIANVKFIDQYYPKQVPLSSLVAFDKTPNTHNIETNKETYVDFSNLIDNYKNGLLDDNKDDNDDPDCWSYDDEEENDLPRKPIYRSKEDRLKCNNLKKLGIIGFEVDFSKSFSENVEELQRYFVNYPIYFAGLLTCVTANFIKEYLDGVYSSEDFIPLDNNAKDFEALVIMGIIDEDNRIINDSWIDIIKKIISKFSYDEFTLIDFQTTVIGLVEIYGQIKDSILIKIIDDYYNQYSEDYLKFKGFNDLNRFSTLFKNLINISYEDNHTLFDKRLSCRLIKYNPNYKYYNKYKIYELNYVLCFATRFSPYASYSYDPPEVIAMLFSGDMQFNIKNICPSKYIDGYEDIFKDIDNNMPKWELFGHYPSE